MSQVEFTITTFAQHIGTTKQNIAQLISKNAFSYPGYRLECGLKRTKIIKVDRLFVFINEATNIFIIVKQESPELAVLDANALLFEKNIKTFIFKIQDAKEIKESETIISNLDNILKP